MTSTRTMLMYAALYVYLYTAYVKGAYYTIPHRVTHTHQLPYVQADVFICVYLTKYDSLREQTHNLYLCIQNRLNHCLWKQKPIDTPELPKTYCGVISSSLHFRKYTNK